MMLVEILMMIIASLVPNFLMGIITGAGVQGLMILSGGFFQPRKDLPDIFWRYPLFYISFHKYAYRGLLNNEFEGIVPQHNVVGGLSSGEEVLKDIWEVQNKRMDLTILVGMVILYRLLYLLIIKINEKRKCISVALTSMTENKM